MPKKVSASLIDCATTPGIRSSSSARHVVPIEAARGSHEHRERSRVVAAFVRLEHRPGGLQERLAERQRHQRRLQQGERVHLLGVVESQLGCDRRAGRVPCDVSAPYT